MTLYDVKPRFQSLLRPIVAKLAETGVSANQVTLAAALGSILIGVMLIVKDASALFLVIPVWLFLRMALNAIDGMLAREFNQVSKLGAYLNEVCDVISDAALYIPFAMIAPFNLVGIGSIVFLAMLTEFVGVMGSTVGASRRYDGPMGKSDRAFVFGALGLWVGLVDTLPSWLSLLVPILVILLVMTMINRIQNGLIESNNLVQD